MKKFFVIILSLLAVSVFAESLDYDQFVDKIITAFPQVEYVSNSCWREWNGDAEACIKYFKENGQCILTDNEL